ncbi:hypothetical protein PR048_027963 [Dryococelus australis]|uniref:Uncharacterized protein n=1 Tax=Dryococelus australis TaxID=614101 RepID=A0ABQ9GHZ5_9NEOP|nr:hypothetical protein PR048_027963 [Dryococelus australis]
MELRRNAMAGKREIPEKTRGPAASSCTIPTCENSGVTRSGIEPGSPCSPALLVLETASRSGRLIRFPLLLLPSLFRSARLANMSQCEVNMEQRRNVRAGETGQPRENPPTNGIVRHDSHLRKSGINRPGIENNKCSSML